MTNGLANRPPQDRTIAVTGSSSGIGAAVSDQLRLAGYRVIGVGRRDADVVADLGTPEGREHAIAEITRLSEGRLSGFLPCAGLAAANERPGALLVSVNYFGAITLLEGLRPALEAAGNASVILMSSNAAVTQPGWPVELAEACLAGDEQKAREIAASFAELGPVHAYPAPKAALAWYARTRSAEYVRAGIRLNAIAPGIIDTPMTEQCIQDVLVGAGVRAFLAATPAGRAGKPEEIAALVSFLLSDQAAYFIGSVVFCDGGTDALARGKDWPAVLPLPS